MASTTYYCTDTTYSALSGYTAGTDGTPEERELSDTAPGSGSLGPYTIDKNAPDQVPFVMGTTAAVHDDNDWTALVAADAQVVLNVTSTDSGLHFGNNHPGNGGYYIRFNSSGAAQSEVAIDQNDWDSDCDTTGVKTYTHASAINLGTAASTDLFGFSCGVEYGAHSTGVTITFGLGSSTYIEAPWVTAAPASLVPPPIHPFSHLLRR